LTAGELSAPPAINNPFRPIKPFPSPNISPQPSIRNPSEDTANTMKFFDSMFTQFFARANPLSTIAKPRFMKKTNIAARSTQIVSMIILSIHNPLLEK
jgi:hypothetical protein